MTDNPRTEEAYSLFHDGILALARAEQAGLRVDMAYIERKKKSLTRKIERLEEEFKQTTFFKHWQHSVKGTININSNIQLGHFLYGVKKLKAPKLTLSGQGSTDEESLKQLNIPELNLLAERDKLKRLRDVNLDGFAREQVNGYIHPFFNLHLARTFRSSANSPNLQNIPIRDEESMQTCRRAIYPRPGHQLLEIDFKGIEVAINCCYNKDSTLIKYVSNPASDMHADLAKQIFKVDGFNKKIPEHYVLRQAAKNGFVFAEFYGDYYGNCATNLLCNWGKLPQGRFHIGEGIPMPEGTLADHLISVGLPSYKVFEEHLKKIEKDLWENRFPEYAEWKDRWYNVYKKYGYIDLLTGFRCSGVMSRNDVINYPGQGTAFHCLLWSLIEMDRAMIKEGWDTRIVSQIHDSVILDINPDELIHVVRTLHNITTEKLPEAWKWIIVPLAVDISLAPVDAPWSEKRDFLFKDLFV